MGKVVYWFDQPDELSQIHSTFHVSHLRKCVVDDSTVVPLNNIQVDERLNYVERLIVILDRKTKTLFNMVVSLVKVKW